MGELGDLSEVGWEPLLARLDADLARAEGDPAGQRDEAAWEELRRRVDRYARMATRKAPPRTGPDPWLVEDEWEREDIVQDVCVKLHARNVLAKLRSARQPKGYLVRMLRNSDADQLRRRRDLPPQVRNPEHRMERTPEDLKGRPPNGAASIAEEASRRGRELRRIRTLPSALAQLSVEDYALYSDLYIRNRDLGEIAAALGISYSAAAGRLRRLKERVRRLMQGDEPAP